MSLNIESEFMDDLSHGDQTLEIDEKVNEDNNKSEPSTPNPMAFTIDFGDTKPLDKSKLEKLAKKSQARHQRVQSMSASLTRSSPIEAKPPLSAKLPRKTQGYNSEGYFSSDQEDSILSGSVKLKQSPLAQNADKSFRKNPKSPITDSFVKPRTSKSPIVDSIMSRSDILPSRNGLNLPLKQSNNLYMKDVQRTTSYNNLWTLRQPMTDIIDQSPEGIMLTDISSPEFDVLTPDNCVLTPEVKSPFKSPSHSNISKNNLFIDDDDLDRQSNSSAGTYTIEGDNYTEEQKARMSIDRTFKEESLERDPELVFDYRKEEDVSVLSPRSTKTLNSPIRRPSDRNVLEISYNYEAPDDLATQTSKQIKSTRNYLEKIKNRVRTITEKIAKSPPKLEDVGSFTSVTTSGVLSTKKILNDYPRLRRCSLTKSEIDQTDYVHRLSRESSVPVNLPSQNFDSTVLRTAQAAAIDNMVGKLSHLSVNRCKGNQEWIQEWANSVKNYNEANDGASDSCCSKIANPRIHSSTVAPSKIPSPVNSHYTRNKQEIPTQDTEAYLLKTQNAITNLQAKLNSNRNYSNISPQLTSSLISEKTIISRLPVSQLSRSNSLNYRLRRKDQSTDSSPLRSPGPYVITGSTLPNSTRILLNSVSRSLDSDRRKELDSNMNTPSPDRGLLSNSSDDRTISNVKKVNTSTRHRSCDGRNLTDNQRKVKSYTPRINYETRNYGDPKRSSHQRNYSDTDKTLRQSVAFGTSIKRCSSFGTVNKNNNLIDANFKYKKDDYLSDDSEAINQSDSFKLKKQPVKPKCPNTPEMPRKFGPGLVRVTSKDRGLTGRLSEPPMAKDDRLKSHHQSRRVSDGTKQAVFNRLSKSRSSTREMQSKINDKVTKKPTQHRSSSALATKEMEFSNWKKRSSYDPMKAAQEGKKKHQLVPNSKRHESNKDDLSSPSHSSPVHRSQSFHSTNLADLETLDYSSEETEDDHILCHFPMDHPMISSTHSDTLDLRPKSSDYRELLRRQALNNDVVLAKDYVTHFKVNQPQDKVKRRDIDKRKTFIIDDVTPTRDNADYIARFKDETIDKRKTFILDSDTNSTTNGSSPRNSSIFSHEKNSLTTATSDTEGESGTESAPVVLRNKKTSVNSNKRHSGDYSMSSSTTSVGKESKRNNVQPKYLDISKYKSEGSNKNFLRRDPSKTYIGVLSDRPPNTTSRGSAQRLELEQKKQELEKWKRRASYDPRKAVALAKNSKTSPKAASNVVLRSQSFHGPVLSAPSLRYVTPRIQESYDQSSDNDF